MVYVNKVRIFSDKEISEIDNFWNPLLVVNKEHLEKRGYNNVVVKSESTINKLVDWFNSLEVEKIIKKPEDLILHRFSEGHYFDKHTDDVIRQGSKRKYLIGVALNDNYEGGKFNTYAPNKLTIGDKVGVPYAIKSNVMHEVTKVIKGVRKTAFVFVNDNHFKKESI
tara:strand:- start:461 stop:961 length:501 start_codon:yes stop_codon:yes gene_type:complete